MGVENRDYHQLPQNATNGLGRRVGGSHGPSYPKSELGIKVAPVLGRTAAKLLPIQCLTISLLLILIDRN